MSYVFDCLVQSDARSRLLRLLFAEGRTGSISELARRSGLSPRAIGVEVEHLDRLDLVDVNAVGATRQVAANWKHPAASLLTQLMLLPAAPGLRDTTALRGALAHYGAPLMGVVPNPEMTLEAALLAGLAAARFDGTLLRVLPVVLAKNRYRLDWIDLREAARSKGLKAELGWLLEETGTLLGDGQLTQRALELRDRRKTRPVYYPVVANRFERQLAEETSPDIARRWGFHMNMSEASIRSLLAKHCPDLKLA